jgi:HEAT repeat protein
MRCALAQRATATLVVCFVLASCRQRGALPVDAGSKLPGKVSRDGPLARVEVGGKWGFADDTGAIAIEPAYEWAESFSGGLAAVRKERWGFIDRGGKVVIDATWLDADPFADGLAAVRDESGWRYIDEKGAVSIAGPFEAARPFACGQARVRRARVYFLGHEDHGTYYLQSSPWDRRLPDEEARWRKAGLDELAGTSHAAAAVTPPAGNRVEELGLARLFKLADDETWADGHPSLRGGIKAEPQREEHVWQVIDRKGAVITPSLVKSCDTDPEGGRVKTVAPPSDADLDAAIAGLHRMTDRSSVFRRMEDLGPLAAPALVRALNDTSQRVRLNALEILIRVGPDAADAVPGIIDALKDSGEVFLAVWALGKMGARAASAVPALLGVHPARPEMVEAAILDIGPAAIPPLLAALDSARPATLLRVIFLLGELGPSADVNGALERLLHDASRPDVLACAALALARWSTDAHGVLEPDLLVRELKNPYFTRKADVLRVLDPATLREPETEKTLLRLAAEKDVRLEAERALVRIEDPAVVPLLVKELDGPDAPIAIGLLRQMGPRAKPADGPIHDLLQRVSSADGHVPIKDLDTRCQELRDAAETLVAMGSEVEDAFTALETQLRKRDSTPDESRPTDVMILGPSPLCETASLAALRDLGPRAARSLPVLLDYGRRHADAEEAVRAVLVAIRPAAESLLARRDASAR